MPSQRGDISKWPSLIFWVTDKHSSSIFAARQLSPPKKINDAWNEGCMSFVFMRFLPGDAARKRNDKGLQISLPLQSCPKFRSYAMAGFAAFATLLSKHDGWWNRHFWYFNDKISPAKAAPNFRRFYDGFKQIVWRKTSCIILFVFFFFCWYVIKAWE